MFSRIIHVLEYQLCYMEPNSQHYCWYHIITVAEVYCKLSEISMLGTLVFFSSLCLIFFAIVIL